jgi:hypothetical protein
MNQTLRNQTRIVLTIGTVLMGAAITHAQSPVAAKTQVHAPRMLNAGYEASVAGRWVSSSINHAYEYEFDNEGSYVFQKVAIANGARIVLNGRGTYELSGSVLYCHQTEVSFAGSPGQLQDETWNFSAWRGTLARNGIVLTR